MRSVARFGKRFRILLGLILFCLLAGIASAAPQEPGENASTDQAGEDGKDGKDGLKREFKITCIDPPEAGINGQVNLAVMNFEEWLREKEISKSELVLFINHKPLTGVPPQFPMKLGTVSFPLKRVAGSEARALKLAL